MGKIWIIIQREFITRVRRPAFFLTTLLAPAGFFILMAASVWISTYNQGTTHIAVVDESGLFKSEPIANADDGSVYFHYVDANYDSLAAQVAAHPDSAYQAIIHIPQGFDLDNPQRANIAYRFAKRPGMITNQLVNQHITDVYQRVRLKTRDTIITTEQIQRIQQKIQLVPESLVNKEEKEGFTAAASGLGIFMGFAIYISLFFYGTMIMKGVQEEKSNRVVEILTSSVKPFQMLMGKILGIGAVGLTQFVLWVLLIIVINVFVMPLMGIAVGAHTPGPGAMQGAGQMDPDDIQKIWQGFHDLPLTQIAILFPLFFLGGFLLYGSLFAAIGAAIGEDGDQQSLMIPVTVPIVISIFIAINVIQNPDSPLGFWGSLIPFTSPVVMSAMLPFVHDWRHIAASLVLLVLGFLITVFIAGRIYRVGILMYGKKISLKEMVRWIFTKG